MDVDKLSGLEILQGHLAGKLKSISGLHETLNIEFAHVSEGYCEFYGTPDKNHRNPHGTVHGGWTASILDGVMGLAVFSTQPKGKQSATVTMEFKIIRPLILGQRYRAEGRVLNSGRSLVHVEGFLKDPDTDKLMASGTATYAVIPRLG